MAPTSRFPIQITVNIDLPGRIEAEALTNALRSGKLADTYRKIFFAGLRAVKAGMNSDEKAEFARQMERIPKMWELAVKVKADGGKGGRPVKVTG